MMDERTFNALTDETFQRIERALDSQDPDDVELDTGGGYLTLTFRDSSRCVISTQRPVREIWMAADNTAWHFSRDDGKTDWVTRKTGEELFATLGALLERKLGKTILL